MTDVRGGNLHVMAIVDDPDTTALMASVFGDAGDDLVVASDLSEGLARAAAEVPDVVFIDVALGSGAGLALVHHVRAVSPDASVYALVRETRPEIGSQVTALGGSGLLVLPVTGDEVLTAVSAVRQRRAERDERRKLEAEARAVEHAVAHVARLGDVADVTDRSVACERIADVFGDAFGASMAMVYVPAGDDTAQLMRVAQRGDVGKAPSFCAEMELHQHARAYGLDVVPLTVKSRKTGLVVLAAAERPDAARSPVVEILAAHASVVLALVQERAQSSRGAMKDPNSSAYTFAYFVDVAGREMDKARRFQRRFSLATIVLEAPGNPDDRLRAMATETADKLLSLASDTDVLARVDDGEFYLLLPETGGAGAHALRRRMMRQVGGDDRRNATPSVAELTIGIATFPHDGADLSRLLRVAKHRADASRDSPVRRLGLERQPLGDVVDLLLWHVSDGSSAPSVALEAPRGIELPPVDLMSVATAAVNEAIRAGEATLIATVRDGVSVGTTVRSILGRNDERVQLVDVSGIRGCEDLEILCVIAEHGAYVLVGRSDRAIVRAVHACDPLLVDLIIRRLGEATGTRLVD